MDILCTPLQDPFKNISRRLGSDEIVSRECEVCISNLVHLDENLIVNGGCALERYYTRSVRAHGDFQTMVVMEYQTKRNCTARSACATHRKARERREVFKGLNGENQDFSVILSALYNLNIGCNRCNYSINRQLPQPYRTLPYLQRCTSKEALSLLCSKKQLHSNDQNMHKLLDVIEVELKQN